MDKLDHTVRIGFYLSSTDPFWVLVDEAATRTAAAMQIDFLPLAFETMQPSIEEQMVLIEEVVAQELDALVIGDLHPSVVSNFADKGIPIISPVESDFVQPLVVSPAGLYQCAQMLGRYLIDQLSGRGKVLIIGGLAGTGDTGVSRIRGMQDALRDYPDMQVIHIPAPWESDLIHEYLEETLAEIDTPVDAVFGLSDTLALVTQEVGTRLGCVNPDTLVVGINGDPLALDAIQGGKMHATVETSASDLGRTVVELAIKAAQGEALPGHFDYITRLVTPDNITEVAVEKMIEMARIPNRLLGVNRHLESRRLQQLETSLTLNRRMGSFLDHQQLRHELANIISANHGYDHFQIFLWSDAQKEFILDRIGEQEEQQVHTPLAESGLLGYTLLENKPTFIPDMHRSQRFPPDPYWPATRSRVILPIRQAKKIVGLLDLHSERTTQHTRHDLTGLQALADQLGVAMRNVQLYREAKDATAEAKRANELKTRLLANVSHELRTPLNVILGYSQSALSSAQMYDADLPAVLQTDLRYIYRSAEHLMHLINDLLDVSRAEIHELEILPELVDTRPFLEDVFLNYASGRHAGGDRPHNQVEWLLEMPRRLPAIQADPLRLRQILLNLLSNADKFTQTGHVLLGAEVAEQDLHIWVQDTGSGISEELRKNITTAFATAMYEQKPGQGVGLGLRITQELVLLHKGRLEIESEPGQGSTFHIFLPLSPPGSQPGDMPEYAAGSGYQPPTQGESLPQSAGPFLPAHHNPLVRQATEYVHRNYGKHITRQEIAEQVGVSENYLTRVFRQELGESLWSYLTNYRVTQATQLLQHTSRSISDVAMMVGFNDAAYFSNVFKKQVGVSPTVYRKQKRRQ